MKPLALFLSLTAAIAIGMPIAWWIDSLRTDAGVCSMEAFD